MYLRARALAILVTATITQSFHYSKTTDIFRRTEDCQMCYQDHCFNMETARCEYYLLADEIQGNEDHGSLSVKIKAIEEDEDLKIKADADEALFDLVEKASEATDKECIPYISRYTDCTKENICLGCTTCDCNTEGRWECTDVQSCRAEKPISVDHRVLIIVKENLMTRDDRSEDKLTKMKRSVTEAPLNTSTNKITFEELSEWWYGVKSLEHEHDHVLTTAKIENTTVRDTAKSGNGTTTARGPQTTETTTESLIISDPDSLAFEEVLSNIGIDTSKYLRRKLPMDLIQTDTILGVNNMILDENTKPMDDDKPDLIQNILNLVDDVNDGIKEVKNESSQVVIDLLETVKKNNRNIKNVTDHMKIYKDNIDVNPPFDNTNDVIEYDAVNIMKRDVSHVQDISETNVTHQTNSTNSTEHKCHMNDTILTSLSDLIADMHKEVKELQSVKDYLINFAKSYTRNVSTEHNEITYDVINSKYVSEYTYNNGSDFRRNSYNMLEIYMNRLKHDIQLVLRDIVGIQKFRSASKFREDLKVLIGAMRRYMGQTGIPGMKVKKHRLNRFKDLRRYIYRHSNSPKDNVIKILNIMDNKMPKAIYIDSLSATARKIVIRVIKQYYIDDFSAIGLRAHDSSYNLTNDLQSVGSKWHELALDIDKSSPFEKLYNMKRLHLKLTQDINKIGDALALVDFVHSRRVIPIFRHMESNIVDKISTSLKTINDKMALLLQIRNRRSKMPTTSSPENTTLSKKIVNITLRKDNVDKEEKSKKSFLKEIRNFLRGSKKDVAELLNKRVPKSEIVQQIARKKMSELAQKRYYEYEETMKRWQKNLNIQPRRKRSMLDTNGFRARMKNIIIPKYLRGKVDGKIVAKKKKTVNTKHASKTTKQKKISVKGNTKIQKSRIKIPTLTTSARLRDN